LNHPESRYNYFQHRSQDFEYLLEGITGIMEQQTAAIKNFLPGAKKSLPYITETSEFVGYFANGLGWLTS